MKERRILLHCIDKPNSVLMKHEGRPFIWTADHSVVRAALRIFRHGLALG